MDVEEELAALVDGEEEADQDDRVSLGEMEVSEEVVEVDEVIADEAKEGRL